jgi:hypothetical protein
VRFADIFSTFGFIVADNRSKDTRVITFFGIGVTAVSSTIILITANNIIIYTTIGGYTISTLAGVSIRTGDWGKFATRIFITRIFSTEIVIITGDKRMPATGTRATSVIGTSVIIIARNIRGLATFFFITRVSYTSRS